MPDSAQSSHPSTSQLTAFAQGKLAAAERATLQAHLKACPACRQALKALPASGKSVSGRDTLATMGASPGRDTLATMGASPSGTTATHHPPGAVPADLVNHPRYEVLQMLGQGGMGAVYKARHKKMDRLVALKVINGTLLNHPKAVERFQREVQAAAKLDHPNIVHAHDADEAGGTHFLVMEFVEGTDLAKYVEKKGALPVAHACHFIRQAALGLEHAHQHGMVHRDIKPHNLMLARPVASAPGVLTVKVMDFGLARLARETVSEAGLTGENALSIHGERVDQKGSASAAGLTGENALMGTADYIAPEQAQDAHTADIRADIYSLGCSLFHLLAGRPPLAGANITQKLAAHLLGKLPLDELPASVPAELRTVLAKMVAKDPAQRYQTPAEVAAALLPFTKKATGEKPAPVPAAPVGDSRDRTVVDTADAMPHAVKATAVATKRSRGSRRSRPAAKPSKYLWLGVGTGVAVLLLGVLGLCLFIGLRTRNASRVKTPEGPVAVEPGPSGQPAAPPPSPPPAPNDPVISDDRIVGKWKSVDAPIAVIQEFSKDGQMKNTFGGKTHTGTYKFNGDIIAWRSGAMTGEVKIKFSSSTEMEMSNELGTVKYKKTGTPQPGKLRPK